MKTFHLRSLPSFSLFLILIRSLSLPVTAAQANWKDFSPQGFVVTGRGQNFCAWSKVTPHTNDQGLVSLRTNSIVHLSPGRAHLQNGVWADSAPELVITNDAVLGRGALCTGRFAANLNTFGATELTTAASTDDDFRDYIRFRPDGDDANNIWITLGRVDWGWSAAATSEGGPVWSIASQMIWGPTLCQDEGFPMWTEVITGTKEN